MKMNTKQNRPWKRLGLFTLVATIVAVMAAPAFAQQRRGNDNDRPRLNVELNQDRREARRDARIELRNERRDRRRPVSSVPEPSAALLFAGGGLIVAQAIRSNRRKQQR